MAEKKSKKIGEEYGIVGFTLGILSIVMVGSNGIILAIIGFIFSNIQQKKNPTRFGKIGKTLSIIGFLLAIVLIILAYIFRDTLMQSLGVQFPTG